MSANASYQRLTTTRALFLSCHTVPQTSGRGGWSWPNTKPYRRGSGSQTRGSAPADSCSSYGSPWLTNTALPSLDSGLPTLSPARSELASPPLHGCRWPARLSWWMFALPWADRCSPVLKHSEQLIMCLKTVMKTHRTKPNTTAQHPLFAAGW